MEKHTYTQTQLQTQTQTLSPQQLLAVQLLELTTVEIEDRVRSEVMDNPVLEAAGGEELPDAAENDSYEEYASDADDDYSGNGELPVVSGRSGGTDMPVADALSFGDTLMEQLGELALTATENAAGEYIIGSLDEDGLLRKPLSEIEDELLIYNGLEITADELLLLLQKIQTFEPAGIAARDLRECLMLQLQRTAGNKDNRLPLQILELYYEDFAGKRWDLLAGKLGVGKEECRDAIDAIVRLNPRPGAALAENVGFSRQQITPDFLLDVDENAVTVSLNNAHVPALRVSEEYRRLLEEQSASGNNEQRAAAQFLKQKIDAAKGFISAVQQREQTMLATMRAIAAMQKEFFLSGGDEALLKPMILEDIAKAAGYDISTISRVSNSKYVQTPWSIYPLKYFFSDGVVKADGSQQSVYELFRIMRELVDSEEKSAPLTDQQLQERLAEFGYNVARRTVAKYREQLGIPVARLRKE